jgi:anti-sigma B factor antagonist
MEAQNRKRRTGKPVIVLQLPERLNLEGAQEFLADAWPLLKKDDRPRIVFDFSEVCQIDSAGVDMLQRCLEEVMKRDGDLKLAAVPAGVLVILELMRADRLFEIFESANDAVESFHDFAIQSTPQGPFPWYSGIAAPGEETEGLEEMAR